MTDCAFDKGEYCTALREKECNSCPFEKTREELVEGRRKALHRINNDIPKSTKFYIIHKYYRQWRTSCFETD